MQSRDIAKPSPAVVAAILVSALFLLRLPSLLLPYELNPDESQMLAQGMKFLTDPVPWRAVDTTTSGPINSWLISVLLLAGFKPGYLLAHLLATTLMCFQLLAAYRTLLHLTAQSVAAVAAVPMVLFYGLASEANFLHYSSELLPALMLALGFLCFVNWLRTGNAALVFLSGLAFGSAPWCKLQAAPIAAALGAAVLAAATGRRRIGNAPAFMAGALLPTLAILGAVAHFGVAGDFWTSYVVGNFAHAGSRTFSAMVKESGGVLISAQILPLFVIDVLAAAFFFHRIRRNGTSGFSKLELLILGSLVLYAGAALFSVSRPFTSFEHYRIFLVLPMTCLAAALVHRDLRLPSLSIHRRLAAAVAFAIVIAWAGNGAGYVRYAMEAIHQPASARQDSNERITAVVHEIARGRTIGSLAIWGWAPGVYVLSGIAPATRDADMSVVITRGPLQGYYRQRFFDDLRGHMPDLFIDAVARGTYMWNPGQNDWTENDGYESYGEVRRFVDENYVLVRELRLRPGAKPVRFFARADR